MLKHEYIKTIKAAGFHDIRIIDETSFSSMVNDSAAKAIIENLKIPSKIIKELASSAMSIKVYGIKPK
jgi:hypothetical protein